MTEQGDKPAVTRESFNILPTESKLVILFDYIVELHKQVSELKSTKIRNTTYSTIAGFVGGAIAVFGTRLGDLFK